MHDFSQFIRDIPDFPKPGIIFKDITPLLGDPTAFRAVTDTLAARYEAEHNIDTVVGIDARGFIFAAALAYRLNAAFVPIRKSGKLPYDTHETTYQLEYGTDTLAVHQDAFPKGSNVLICDDVLATGGTLEACVDLIEKLDGNIVEIALLIELTFLNGREKVPNHDVFSLIQY